MKQVITTYHHGFAGGSKNTSRLLRHLNKDHYQVDAFFFETPDYLTLAANWLNIHQTDREVLQSEVIEVKQLDQYLLAENIFAYARNADEPILFAANMFPYCNTMHDIKSQLLATTQKNPRLVIHPVGSDLWQIGTNFKSRVKYLLESALTDAVWTYSRGFAEEIQEYYGVNREIKVVPPLIESEEFKPISYQEKIQRRRQIGFQEEHFIIHHHSSMRKIKSPETVIYLASRAATSIKTQTILIMVGPIPLRILEMNGWNLGPSDIDFFQSMTSINKLKIYWTGISKNVSYLLQISDMEVNCSLHDSFNISLMEAMACGLPVVTTDIVGIKEHILECDGGYVFNTFVRGVDEINAVINKPEKPARLFKCDDGIDAIIQLANSSEEAMYKGKSAANYVSHTFCPEKIIPQFLKILAE